MNQIDKKFNELRKKKKKAFIAYIMAGDPVLSVTKDAVLALEKSGVDIIELGIPFSDPLADGPTIQAAAQRALRNKVSLNDVFKLVKNLRNKTAIPVVFMTYYNPVLKHGLERFVRDCRISGVDGVIIPDLPHEEAKDLVKFGKRHKVSTIFLVAPTSTRKRIADIARNSNGFIYYVSLTGVTGARKKLPGELTAKLKLVKSITNKPVCVGFGVSNPKQAKDIARISDGVIVGSAIVKLMERKDNLISRVSKFSKSLARAIHG